MYAPGVSVARMADSKSLVGGIVVASMSACWDCCLVVDLPVVVGRYCRAALMQFQSRIRQSNTNTIERRTNPANKDPLWLGSGDDKATDQNFITGKNPHARGNVERVGVGDAVNLRAAL